MMAEESEVQPVNKTYNTIEPKVGLGRQKQDILNTQTMQVETKRVPRRVLHFSDGVIEEYSTDEEAEREEEEKRQKDANQQV